MGESLLCVYHSVSDYQGVKGCFSLYYSDYAPMMSFAHYSVHNPHIQVFSFSMVSSLVSPSGESAELNIFITGQPYPSVFLFNSKNDVFSLMQVAVSNGILKSNPEKHFSWVPSGGCHPSDPVDWILQNSSPQISIPLLHHNSGPPYYLSILGTSFSSSSHRSILKQLIINGIQSSLMKKMNQETQFHKQFSEKANLEEYINTRKQWECRITHQKNAKSKHNTDVEKINKELDSLIPNSKTQSLLYNVMRTMITFAPDLGYSQGMVEVACFLAKTTLENIETDDDVSQSIVFWFLYSLLFDFGQSKWYNSTESTSALLVDDISDVLSTTYPAIGSYVSFNNYEMFKNSVSYSFSMLTKILSHSILKRLLPIVVHRKSVDVMYASVLTTILITEFPELSKSRVPDTAKISQILSKPYHVREEEEFLAIVASIADRIPSRDIEEEHMFLSFQIFKPIGFSP